MNLSDLTPGTYYFSATNGLDARGRNVETPQPPEAVTILPGDGELRCRWPDGMVTRTLTIVGRLGRTPDEATENTRRCIAAGVFV